MHALALAFAVLLLALPGLAGELPAEHECPTVTAQPVGRAGDAVPVPIKEGMVLSYEDVLALRVLVPPEVWRNRDAFFFEGMRMVIGPCHLRYPVPAFYERATRKHAGEAKLDDEGNLRGYRAGLPFPPETLDPETKHAAVSWAWNLEYRYRGAGPSGKFRLVDMPSRVGHAQTYYGSFYLLKAHHRADLPHTDYAIPEAGDNLWVSGGRFDRPFNTRHLAWRQFRRIEVQGDYDASDELFVYVPNMRKVRRAATTWVDGLFMPRYRVTGDDGGGGMPVGGREYGPGAVLNPTASKSAAASEHIERGLSALSLRPNAYHWRYRGAKEVLAPLNNPEPGYPLDLDRNFGPSGLSVANGTWDLRYAVILDAVPRRGGLPFDALRVYVDYQTRQPLYWMTKQRRGESLGVGIHVHRFSDTLRGYPAWPNGEKASVFDPVAAVYYGAAEGGTGWRRESFAVTSTPPDPHDLHRYLSSDSLARGR